MHMQQPLRAAALVKIVDILGDDQKLATPFGIETPERMVRGIGFDAGEIGAALVVEIEHEIGIARESLGGGDILDAMALPQAVGSAKDRDTAFGGNPGSGEDDNIADVRHAIMIGRARARTTAF